MISIRCLLRTMGAVTLAATMAIAMAQGGPGGGPGGGQGRGGMRGGGMMGMQDRSGVMLLVRADVQRDLKLTSEQQSKLQAMQASMMERMREMWQNNQGGQPNMDALRQMNEAMQKEVATVLTPAQMKRLGEIRVQLQGNRAALDPEVQKELGITAEQKGRLDQLQQGLQSANQSVRQRMQNGDISREEGMASMQRNNEVMNQEIAKILTAAQNEKLKTMGGAKFEADEQPMGGFGGGRRDR